MEEIVVPFPVERRLVPRATMVRSTLLISSQRTLRELGRIEAYHASIAPQHREALLMLAGANWLPLELAMAHYDACEALRLTEREILAIGGRVGQITQGSWLGVAIKLVTGAGADPWTVLGQGRRMWERVWIGSATQVTKVGPKDARVEIVGWPPAAIPYCRIAFRGILCGLVQLVSRTAVARDLPKLCTTDTVGYLVSWA